MLRLKYELCDRLKKLPSEIETMTVKDLRYFLALDALGKQNG